MAEFSRVGANLAGRVGSTRGVKFASVAPITKAISDEIDYQRERAKEERERRRNLQDRMFELHGEDIFNNYESTGFEDPDALGRSISNKVMQVYTGLNKQFSMGEISEADFLSKAYKIVGQTKKAAKDFVTLKEYANKLNESGDDLSQTALDNAERIQSYFKGVGFDLDEDYNMTFFGERTDENGNKVQIRTPFDKLGKELEIRKGYDFSEVSNAIFAVDSEANKYFERGTVFKRWLDNGGQFSNEQKSFIDKYARATLYDDDYDLYDAAKRSGIKVERDEYGNVKNKDVVFDAVKKEIEQKVKTDYILRASSDQVEGQKLLNEMERISIAKDKPTKDQTLYNRVYESFAKARNGGESEMRAFVSTARSIPGVGNAYLDSENKQFVVEFKDSKGNITFKYFPLSGDGREDNMIAVGGLLGDPEMAAKAANIFDKSNKGYNYDYTYEGPIGDMTPLKSPSTVLSNRSTAFKLLDSKEDEEQIGVDIEYIINDLYGVSTAGLKVNQTKNQGFFGEDEITLTLPNEQVITYNPDDETSVNQAILAVGTYYRKLGASTSKGRYSGF